MTSVKEAFGSTGEGEDVFLFTLTNTHGMVVKLINYGGIVVSLEAPDREGNIADVALGYETLEEYLDETPYFGALVGRYGNRISEGKFTLAGKDYHLAVNDGPNHLHGGTKGFDKVVWDAVEVESEEGVAVKLTYLSPDGQEGYPGNLRCTIIYTLTDQNELKIEYKAHTDQATVINLTHHSYFNLSGHHSGDILSHWLQLHAGSFTPVDAGLIPTGEIMGVAGTPLDFTGPQAIGARIGEIEGGYDHNFVLDSQEGSLVLAARLTEPVSGRVMEVYTTEPAIQFYSGNFLDGTLTGKGGAVYQKHAGLCLETQHYPDSPNKPQFPSTVLHPGDAYSHLTIYKFTTE